MHLTGLDFQKDESEIEAAMARIAKDILHIDTDSKKVQGDFVFDLL